MSRWQAVRDPRHLGRVGLIASGVVAAATPAVVQACAARSETLLAQGSLALALTVGAFLAQLALAATVETWLACRADPRLVVLPRLLGLIAIAGCVLFAIQPFGAASAWIGLPPMLAGLLVGRSACVVRERTAREIGASAALGALLVAAYVSAGRLPGASFALIGLGAAVSIAIRTSWGSSMRDLPPAVRSRRLWIVGETGTTGALQPIVNTLLFALLGPSASVAFRLVSTVSGGFEPILSFARTRLLVHPSRADLAVSGAALVAGFAAVVLAATTGLLHVLFGAAWSPVLLPALLLACVWRMTTLITTVPFTALRRRGRAALVYWLRLASTVLYFALGIGAALSGALAMTFGAFLLAELITCALYTAAERREAAGDRVPAADRAPAASEAAFGA